MIPNVLTIAGSDPSGGAGIQADLKTFSALGAYGMSVITALTAQNTQGVRGFQVVEPGFVAAQIDAIFDDVRVDAVKIGMVATAAVATAVADRLRHHAARNVVLDPVMVAKSGDRLLREDAVAALRDRLAPLARVITPNLPEAARAAGRRRADDAGGDASGGPRAAPARRADCVLLKGGHLAGRGEPGPAVRRRNDHGIHQRADRHAQHAWHRLHALAAIAALLPRHDMVEAVRRAKAYLTGAIAASGRLAVGHGHGPVHHFHALWRAMEGGSSGMTSFSEAAWQRTARLRQAIHDLPFNTELANGALSRARFQGYVIQDALYLGQYSRVLAMAGVKGPDGATLHAFASSALEAVAVEQALHEQYLRSFGIDPAQLAAVEPSPDCLGYTSFLLATAYHDPWEVLVAALLPCFWVYWDVGTAIAQRAACRQSVSGVDRHLRRRGIWRGGAHRHRHHRPRGGGRGAGHGAGA